MSTSFLPVPQFNSFCSFLNFLCLFHGFLISIEPISYFIHKKKKGKRSDDEGGRERRDRRKDKKKGEKRFKKKKKQLISSASITTTLPANLLSCQHQDPSLPLSVMTTDKQACLAMPVYSWAVLIGPLQVSLSALVLLGQSIIMQT